MIAPPLRLQVRRASKAYAGVPALTDAGLDLVGGEVHGLIGENGAGKSTLIKLLAGLEVPDSLSLRLNGAALELPDSAAAYRVGFRFIHQELSIVPALSVAENLFISNPLPRLAGVFVDWKDLHRRAGAVLQRLGIGHINPRRRASGLSAGDAMLVKIAGAFIGVDEGDERLIMIMDEPTASLNSDEVELLFDVIDRLRSRGYALLYVTHRLDELYRIAQRVTVMRDGRVISTHAVADTSTATLIREMTGRSVDEPSADLSAAQQPERLRLRVCNLRTDAVAQASLELNAGEIMGIAGLVGSGRSELLYALFGIDPLLGGDIELDGQSLTELSPARAWNLGIAYVPEERRSQGLFLSDQVSQNITLPHLDRFGVLKTFVNEGRARARSRNLGESVALKITGLRQRVRQLSGGNQQKILFARAILAQPRLILLDEPTRGVDVGAKFDIYRLIRELAGQGASILMVSSELDELIALCDRIVVMRNGRTADVMPAAGLSENQLLERCYEFS
ncbi:MAG: sugar ABC transporter ATP-binding protein [Chloroflexi bacterium]|nr:sugar ABC transporter ATP-binding protein [Chloroflexota bacterium]